MIVIRGVVEGLELRWHDVQQGLDAGIELANAGGHTRATAFVSGPWWRLVAEGARRYPHHGLARLHALCQTAAEL